MRRALPLVALIAFTSQAAEIQNLPATPANICWGYYWAQANPAIKIHSGDRVRIQTVSGNPTRLLNAGAKPDEIQPELKAIYDQIPAAQRGPGGHILTGAVYIEEAEPGDVLEVRIEKITMDVPYAYNGFSPNGGFMKADFPKSRGMKVIPLDRKRNLGEFAAGIEIPLHPFFGSMGIAPPGADKVNSAPPNIWAGNMDNKELVQGTTLYIPVHQKGALFEVGDGHAGMGNGEVDITALETSLTGTFQFIVHKGVTLKWPRAETPTQYITMGFDEDLTKATDIAVREMIDFLSAEKHLSREEAYMLTSVAVDVDITQLVDGNKGVHALCPKTIFTHEKNVPMIAAAPSTN
ncbi:MAG TPA: acetamidase/formamidase family protein [Bryobacteraceae bacterium]|nr:acetamidase/formamidase family protein [Bryobacteraceae bacterium]